MGGSGRSKRAEVLKAETPSCLLYFFFRAAWAMAVTAS